MKSSGIVSPLYKCWQKYRASQLHSQLNAPREKLRITSCESTESGAFLRVTVLHAARRMFNEAFVPAICLGIGHPLSIVDGTRIQTAEQVSNFVA